MMWGEFALGILCGLALGLAVEYARTRAKPKGKRRADYTLFSYPLVQGQWKGGSKSSAGTHDAGGVIDVADPKAYEAAKKIAQQAQKREAIFLAVRTFVLTQMVEDENSLTSSGAVLAHLNKALAERGKESIGERDFLNAMRNLGHRESHDGSATPYFEGLRLLREDER